MVKSINFKYKHNNFNDEFNLKKSNFYNRIIKTQNFHKVKKGKYKINKSTNISKEFNKIQMRNNEINEDKMIYTEKNDINNFRLFKPKPFMLKKIQYPLKDYNSINNNKKIINKMNFITNIKSSNSKISNDNNDDNKNIFFNKSLYIHNIKNVPFKKGIKMQSLKENSVWNDYLQTEKNKKFQQLKNKRKMRQDIFAKIKSL